MPNITSLSPEVATFCARRGDTQPDSQKTTPNREPHHRRQQSPDDHLPVLITQTKGAEGFNRTPQQLRSHTTVMFNVSSPIPLPEFLKRNMNILQFTIYNSQKKPPSWA